VGNPFPAKAKGTCVLCNMLYAREETIYHHPRLDGYCHEACPPPIEWKKKRKKRVVRPD
jgi:hypothetical protein